MLISLILIKTMVYIAVFLADFGYFCICIDKQRTMLIFNWLTIFGKYLLLMGRAFSRPERFRMFLKRYVKEMSQLGVDSVGIRLAYFVLHRSCYLHTDKLNVQSPWMPLWVSGYVTREIMLLEFSSSIMCLILAGKVGSNIASELGTMRVTQQIDALEIMGINSASYLICRRLQDLLRLCLSWLSFLLQWVSWEHTQLLTSPTLLHR